jgi:hypothetical protein
MKKIIKWTGIALFALGMHRIMVSHARLNRNTGN